MRRLAALAVAAGAVAIGVGGCSNDDEPGHRAAASVARVPLLVSGKDDHGLQAEPHVELLSAPNGEAVSSVRDETLVVVVRERGEWFYVRVLEGEGADGWVNDFYLRGTVHVVARDGCGASAAPASGGRPDVTLTPNVQARLVAVANRGDGTSVRVRTLIGGEDVWVDRSAIRELPSARVCPRA